MVKDDYTYTHEKLSIAMRTLATGPKDIRFRLSDAFLNFSPLDRQSFPKELRADWDYLMKELMKLGPILESEEEDKMVELAKKIVDLKYKIEDYL